MNDCLSCADTFFMQRLITNTITGECKNDCTIGYKSLGDCLLCDAKCKTCRGPLPTDCLSCDAALFL